MRDLVRLMLMLGIAACAATLIGAVIAWWMEEQRRMTRLAVRVLGGQPEGLIVAQGRGAAAAFRLDAGKVLVMRRNGAFALLYPLDMLQGAELLVDDQVVARVAQGEPKRPLERIPATAEHVALRLIFDDARHPDFNLELWRPDDVRRRNNRPAPMVIQEARGWLTRAEALIRRRGLAASAPATIQPRDETFTWEDDAEQFDDDTTVEVAPHAAPAQANAPEPPWDEAEDEPSPPPTPGVPARQLRLF